MARPLGLRPPTDDRHLAAYPLTAATIPATATPVIAGTSWHTSFDEPVWDERGRFWLVGKDPRNLGNSRGGHCYCLKPDKVTDTPGWWRFYDQGQEGACVGFGVARAMTLDNRRRYAARELYLTAKTIDEWPGEDYEGTSLRAGLDVARERGLIRVFGRNRYEIEVEEGIAANRWALNPDDIIAAMHSPRYLDLGRIPFLNSWGEHGYPHLTWMPIDTIDHLMANGGEYAVIVDR